MADGPANKEADGNNAPPEPQAGATPIVPLRPPGSLGGFRRGPVTLGPPTEPVTEAPDAEPEEEEETAPSQPIPPSVTPPEVVPSPPVASPWWKDAEPTPVAPLVAPPLIPPSGGPPAPPIPPTGPLPEEAGDGKYEPATPLSEMQRQYNFQHILREIQYVEATYPDATTRPAEWQSSYEEALYLRDAYLQDAQNRNLFADLQRELDFSYVELQNEFSQNPAAGFRLVRKLRQQDVEGGIWRDPRFAGFKSWGEGIPDIYWHTGINRILQALEGNPATAFAAWEWQSPALTPEQKKASEIPRGSSEFKELMKKINILSRKLLSKTIPVDIRTQLETELTQAKEARDKLVVEANDLGLISNELKWFLYSRWRYFRIRLPLDQRRDEFEQYKNDAKLRSQENPAFWEQNMGENGEDLFVKYGGVIDYFWQEGWDLMGLAIFKDRWDDFSKKVQESAVGKIWNIEDLKGNPVVGVEAIKNLIEKIRISRKRYAYSRERIGSLVPLVDDIDELPDVVLDYFRRSAKALGKARIDVLIQNIEQKKNTEGATLFDEFLQLFPEYENDPRVERAQALMNAMFSMFGAEAIAGKGKEAWPGFFHFLKDFVQDWQSNFDALYFKPLVARALYLFAQNDGEYFRLGAVSEEDPELGEMEAFKKAKKREFVEDLVRHKLRGTKDLLNNHPVFQRLKKKLDDLDRNDPDYNSPDFVPRWEEYTQKALAAASMKTAAEQAIRGEGVEELVDEKEERIKFEHVLARSLTEAEFEAMYEEIQIQDVEDFAAKKKEATEAVAIAERMMIVLGPGNRFAGPRLKPDGGGLKLMSAEVRGRLVRYLELDAKRPVDQQVFRVTHTLHKLGIHTTLPVFNMFHLGADDPIRTAFEKHLDKSGFDVSGMRWRDWIMKLVEIERRAILEVERTVRKEYSGDPGSRGRMQNFRGAIKDIKNIFYGSNGIGASSVRATLLQRAVELGVRDLTYEFGSWDFREFVGLLKRVDEVEFTKEGSLFQNPLDAIFWHGRYQSGVERRNIWNSGSKEHQLAHGILEGGPLKGGFRIAALHLAEGTFGLKTSGLPDDRLEKLLAKAKPQYIDTAAGVVGPIMVAMQANKEDLENIYSESAGTARYINTLLWEDFKKWVKTDEFKEFGYPVKAFSNPAMETYATVMRDDGLIYSQEEWVGERTYIAPLIVDMDRESGRNIP